MDEKSHFGLPKHTSLQELIQILFLSFLLISEVYGFGRPRRQNRKSSRSTKNCNKSDSAFISSTEKPKEEINIHLNPYYNCNFIRSGIVQKIPYKSISGTQSPIEVDFSSACVRCGICLAIAKRINETLIEVHDSMPSNQWLEDEETNFLFNITCDEGFKHYALREIDGERYIGDNLPEAILVVTTVDGHWETILKNKCYEILKQVGSRNLYKFWRDWCNGLTNELGLFLCRNESGGLRDCRSIDDDGNHFETCQNNYYAGIKVKAEFY